MIRRTKWRLSWIILTLTEQVFSPTNQTSQGELQTVSFDLCQLWIKGRKITYPIPAYCDLISWSHPLNDRNSAVWTSPWHSIFHSLDKVASGTVGASRDFADGFTSLPLVEAIYISLTGDFDRLRAERQRPPSPDRKWADEQSSHASGMSVFYSSQWLITFTRQYPNGW